MKLSDLFQTLREHELLDLDAELFIETENALEPLASFEFNAKETGTPSIIFVGESG